MAEQLLLLLLLLMMMMMMMMMLAGTIPAAYTRLTALNAVYFYGNEALSGCMPASWEPQLESVLFDVDYFLLEGTQLRSFANCTGAAV
jgi:hypothetical protein